MNLVWLMFGPFWCSCGSSQENNIIRFHHLDIHIYDIALVPTITLNSLSFKRPIPLQNYYRETLFPKRPFQNTGALASGGGRLG